MQLNMQSSSSSSNNNTNNQEAATDKPSTSKQANNNNVAAQQQQRASSPSDSSSASSSSFDSLCNIGPEDGIKAYIKIGPDYQVDLAPYNMKLYKDSDRPNIAEKADLIWRPSEKVSDKQMDQYLSEVINEHAYNIHQAIGLLNFCDHDINKATALSRKLKPKPEEWTKEEKVMFEHAFWFHGKNFNKIKLLLPHKSQASLVNYYYTWKKTRMQKSLMDYQMDLKSANSNSGVDQNNGNGSSRNGGAHNGDELNENGVVYEELDLTEKSDDNDSIDENENGSGKICCNCDFITTDLQSTVKGMLCNPCYAYFKESGGLMRPDSIVNKTNVGVGGSTSSQQQPHGHLSTSAFRTNRFLTITNNGNSSSGSVNVDNATQQSSSSNSAQGLSKDAKSFHKSLRKPPKGIYLNYEELVELAKDDTRKVFNQLNRRISALKKQSQANKQEIDEFMTKANATENEPFRSEINNLLCEIEERISVAPTTGWTQKEVLYALRAFSKYGNNFEIISLIIPTKPESSIRAFYYYYKDIYNLDKLVLNSDELEKISDEIHKEVNDKLTSVVASSNEEAATKSS